jgi:hypothetical protein
MERNEHQHGCPECVARNIGIERLNYAYETVRLLEAVHLFRRCFLQHLLLGFVGTPIVTREGARWFKYRRRECWNCALGLGFRLLLVCKASR